MMKTFGHISTGEETHLYTISCGHIRASITNYGAALVSLQLDGTDVVLGYDSVTDYETQGGYLGAVVGRFANRVRGAQFPFQGGSVTMEANENGNCLHSGPDGFSHRLWKMVEHTETYLRLTLFSPDGDQGFPGNLAIFVTYTLTENSLTIEYDAATDADTVINMTNHAYFNLFGHNRPEKAMDQELKIPGTHFCPDDAQNIPTGELRSVEGTPFDFRAFKPIGRDIGADYEPLHLQGGYDHNFVNAEPVCAVLRNPDSGLTMTVTTDCPGVQVYAGNYLDNHGKDGVYYGFRSGVALETQFYPDCVHHPEWPQPFVRANGFYHSTTTLTFSS